MNAWGKSCTVMGSPSAKGGNNVRYSIIYHHSIPRINAFEENPAELIRSDSRNCLSLFPHLSPL